ncbi:hypothetical protein Tco_0732226, partial [Tanacetum coccineum]
RLKAFLWSWDVLAVSVQSPQGNPSLSLALHISQPLMGIVGLSDIQVGRVIGVMGRWEMVWVSWEGTWDSGLELETVGRGGLGLAGRWLQYRVGCRV